jgi:hypothetical protein
VAQFIRQIMPTSAPMVDVFATREESTPGYYCERIAALALVDFWNNEVGEDEEDDQDEKRPPHGVNPSRWVEPVRCVDQEIFTTDRPDRELWLGIYFEDQLREPDTQHKLVELAKYARERRNRNLNDTGDRADVENTDGATAGDR